MDPVFAHLLHGETVMAAGLTVGGLAALVAARRARWSVARGLFVVAMGGLGFQIAHVLEHVLQAGYWVAHPTQAPWLTPWAVEGRDVLARLADGQPATGTELLHLLGNAIFMVGIVALALWHRRAGRPGGGTAMRWAIGLQGIHVIDHVLLTVTWMVFGQTWAATNLFGLIPDGTVIGHAVRVWAHFLINTAATWAAVVAAVRSGAVRALWPGPASGLERPLAGQSVWEASTEPAGELAGSGAQ